MYTCGVWVCMFHMYGWAYAHIWRSEVDVRRLPQSLSTSIHSGKVWLVLLASLPQGFCLCLCYAGITGSAVPWLSSFYVSGIQTLIHTVLYQQLCTQPNNLFIVFEVCCITIFIPSPVNLWGLVSDPWSLPSFPSAHSPPEWLIILIFTITKMPFVYVLIFLIYFYRIQYIPIASSPPPLLPVSPPPPLSPRYPALQFPLRKEPVSQGYQPNRA